MDMAIKPVRTESDHELALKEIEELWSAEPGTDDADRLDVLATLVDAYEAKHHPIRAVPYRSGAIHRYPSTGV
jgi:HTH-type transcriptional regulator/antitoxin HigA